jgi:hypothetical protein
MVERADTLSLKSDLADVLGDKAGLYWKSLKEFLLSQISLSSFSAIINPILSLSPYAGILSLSFSLSLLLSLSLSLSLFLSLTFSLSLSLSLTHSLYIYSLYIYLLSLINSNVM